MPAAPSWRTNPSASPWKVLPRTQLQQQEQQQGISPCGCRLARQHGAGAVDLPLTPRPTAGFRLRHILGNRLGPYARMCHPCGCIAPTPSARSPPPSPPLWLTHVGRMMVSGAAMRSWRLQHTVGACATWTWQQRLLAMPDLRLILHGLQDHVVARHARTTGVAFASSSECSQLHGSAHSTASCGGSSSPAQDVNHRRANGEPHATRNTVMDQHTRASQRSHQRSKGTRAQREAQHGGCDKGCRGVGAAQDLPGSDLRSGGIWRERSMARQRQAARVVASSRQRRA